MKTGNNNASGQQIDQKSDQWFGATVRSAGPNGPVLVSWTRIFNKKQLDIHFV
jgi:hypothetical protein